MTQKKTNTKCKLSKQIYKLHKPDWHTSTKVVFKVLKCLEIIASTGLYDLSKESTSLEIRLDIVDFAY